MRTFSMLLSALLLVACAADSDSPLGAETSPLVFRATAFSPDAGPASARFWGPLDIVNRRKICWWHPEPQDECVEPSLMGREPTCPTCCKDCFRQDLNSTQYAFLKAGPDIEVESLADHVVLSRSPYPGTAKDDHEFVKIQPAQAGDSYQAVAVPPAYVGASDVYVWFVQETDLGSRLYGATLLPKL